MTRWFLAICTLLGAAAMASEVPHIIDRDGPTQGTVSLELDERWRVGGEDGEVIFGRIIDVGRHRDGCIYVLDNQLCQVVVVAPTGEVLRTLSREGDGPGELRQPMALAFLPDDVLGVGMGYPGRMVTMGLDGTPMSTLYPIGEPAEGNVGLLMNLQYAGDVLVACGGRMVFQGQGDSHVDRFLSVSDAGVEHSRRILERVTPIDPTGVEFVEADDYYIDRSWALSADGHVFAPMARGRYEISEFDADGELVRVFGRVEEPRRRSQAEMDDVTPLINVGLEGQRRWTIAETDPSVTRIMCNPDDQTIWVLTPRGNHDQPDGILEAWDVFDREGQYVRRVTIPLGHEIRDGACHLVGGGQLVVVRGTGSSFDGEDAEVEDDLEIEPLEVICYAIR